ncbi:hypothetical protein [Pseudonocardia sp. ICBG1293]|uniref:hypothetical protein n=1 Tax=Pseudonocardia sp. ICBG1293 TaxID=2844382 RepID=UPI001CC9D104|nr:hypothetical protein [Pseudonocardia sp. ICBG1293]
MRVRTGTVRPRRDDRRSQSRDSVDRPYRAREERPSQDRRSERSAAVEPQDVAQRDAVPDEPAGDAPVVTPSTTGTRESPGATGRIGSDTATGVADTSPAEAVGEPVARDERADDAGDTGRAATDAPVTDAP